MILDFLDQQPNPRIPRTNITAAKLPLKIIPLKPNTNLEVIGIMPKAANTKNRNPHCMVGSHIIVFFPKRHSPDCNLNFAVCGINSEVDK